MPKPIHDFTGRRVGKVVVLERLKAAPNKVVKYRCRCDCGGEDVLTTQRLVGNGTGFVPACRFCSEPPTRFDNAAARRFLSAPRPRIAGDLTMGSLVAKHCRKTPAFKPYRVRIQGDWG